MTRKTANMKKTRIQMCLDEEKSSKPFNFFSASCMLFWAEFMRFPISSNSLFWSVSSSLMAIEIFVFQKKLRIINIHLSLLQLLAVTVVFSFQHRFQELSLVLLRRLIPAVGLHFWMMKLVELILVCDFLLQKVKSEHQKEKVLEI